jgi:hypothetical protein
MQVVTAAAFYGMDDWSLEKPPDDAIFLDQRPIGPAFIESKRYCWGNQLTKGSRTCRLHTPLNSNSLGKELNKRLHQSFINFDTLLEH